MSTDDSSIGFWVGRPDTKLHLVESEIADRVVTRCGREMRRLSGRLELTLGGSQPRCRQCDVDRRA